MAQYTAECPRGHMGVFVTVSLGEYVCGLCGSSLQEDMAELDNATYRIEEADEKEYDMQARIDVLTNTITEIQQALDNDE